MLTINGFVSVVVFFIKFCFCGGQEVFTSVVVILLPICLRPTSSGVMLQTGIPLTSRIWSPVCTEVRMSGLRTAESNLGDSDNERMG